MVLKSFALLKLFLKSVHINSIRKFHIGKGAGVGAYSRMLFSKDPSGIGQSISIGNYAGVGRNCELHVWDNNKITIKDYATINDNCKLLGDVTVEKYCLLSSNIFASSGNHYAFVNPVILIKDQDKDVLSKAEGRQLHSNPIRIEEDCWIGYGVFIRQGITIGRGAVIGANSVVLHDVEPYSVQGGIPARELKKRFAFQPPASISGNKNEHLPFFYRGFLHKAEMLKDSRNTNCIYLEQEAIAILSGVDTFSTLQIIGVKPFSGDVELVVTYQEEYQWKKTIVSNTFDLTLYKEDAVSITAKTCRELFESVKKQMQAYSVICVAVYGASSNNYLGITLLTIQK